MKKILSQYSFVILFVILSLVMALVLSSKSQPTINDEYLSITIEKGDSLWELATTYEHDLSAKQFINWVKKENKINDEIVVGESIIIPIKKEDILVASGEQNE